VYEHGGTDDEDTEERAAMIYHGDYQRRSTYMGIKCG